MSETLYIQKSKRAWGIFSRIRVNSKSKWGSWIGPVGVHCLELEIPKHLISILKCRPFVFRTRTQARAEAKNRDLASNLTWTWVQHAVRPIQVTYEVLK